MAFNILKSFLSTQAQAAQTPNFAAADHVKFNAVLASHGTNITLNTASPYSTVNGAASVGRFTLQPGHIYQLIAVVQNTFTGNNGSTLADWYNATAGTVLSVGFVTINATAAATASANQTGGNAVATQVTVAGSPMLVEVRFNGAGSGAFVDTGPNFAFIQELT